MSKKPTMYGIITTKDAHAVALRWTGTRDNAQTLARLYEKQTGCGGIVVVADPMFWRLPSIDIEKGTLDTLDLLNKICGIVAGE